MTESQLCDPEMMTKPLTWEQWFLRVLILEPHRVCDPGALAKWKETQTQCVNAKTVPECQVRQTIPRSTSIRRQESIRSTNGEPNAEEDLFPTKDSRGEPIP